MHTDRKTHNLTAWVLLIGSVLTVEAGRLCPAAAQPPLALSSKGTTDYTIVVAADAIVPEQTAARELQEHLNKVTGARWEIRREQDVAEDARQIVVGPSSRFQKACPDVNLAALKHDGIVMRTVGANLYLAGGRPRGTLYAVYTFLEDVVGCRWWSSRQGEVFLPSKPTLTVAPLKVLYVPKLQYREAFYRDALDGIYAARSRCNGHFARTPAEYGGHYTLLGWCHTAYTLLPPDKYFKDRPDWYSLINGKRVAEDAQLCLTNDAMRAELTRNALAWVRANPQAGIISISQNDCHGPCQCERCQTIVRREGAESGPLIEFVNQVAQDIEKEFPGFLIETLAYQYTRAAPKTVRPRGNVIVRLCTIECSFSQPLATGPQNEAFRRDIQAWSPIAPQLYLWDYTTVFSNYIQPHPNLRVLAQNIRYFVDHKVIGLFEQGDSGCSCSDFPELRGWLLAHLMWNPALNERVLTEEFMNGYYGAAGKPLLEYIERTHNAVERAGTYLGCFLADTSGWLTFDEMNRATELFDQAAAAVAGDAALSQRVRRARMPLDHMWIRRYGETRRTASQTGKPFNGPKDIEEFCKDFVRTAEQFQVGQYSEGSPFSEHAPRLLSRNRKALPPEACAGLPEADWIDFQEADFSLAGESRWVSIVEDTKASNRLTARMPSDHPQWATQTRIPADVAKRGRWQCFVVARCEAKAKTGPAFQIGLYDDAHRRGVAGTIVQIEQSADGNYHVFDLGEHELTSEMYFWVSPLNNPASVDAVFVDRFFLIRKK